jgi:murein L,D-transpeptidase YafK
MPMNFFNRFQVKRPSCFSLISGALSFLFIALLMTSPVYADRAARAEKNVLAALTKDAKALDVAVGAPVFIRIFKEESTLELWLKGKTQYVLFRSYPICRYSGTLGPKLREGDGQAPEGIYQVGVKQMNPFSSYHLSFNLGYPNAFDQAHQRTGSALMVHGNCVSIGCYAMTDAKIEEIYTLIVKAFAAGQKQVQVHAYPFRMDPKRLARASNDVNYPFWQDLSAIDAVFESTRLPPQVIVKRKRYVLR